MATWVAAGLYTHLTATGLMGLTKKTEPSLGPLKNVRDTI